LLHDNAVKASSLVPFRHHLKTLHVQAVYAGVRLPERNSTGILVGPDSVCRQYCTSSATRSVDLLSGGITNTSGINRGPCVRRCRSTSVKQSTASLPLNLQIVLFLRKRTYIV